MNSCEYEVLTPVGTVIFTSTDKALARSFAKERGKLIPGLRIESVERIEYRRRIWTDRTETKGEREAA